MRLRAVLPGLAAAAGLWLAGVALADEAAPPPLPPGGPEFCKQNPAKCEEMRAKRDAFCKENPDRCAELEQKRAERQEFCKQNPEKCQEQRALMQQRRAEIQKRCAEDPAKCDQIKQQMRERWKTRHGGSRPSGPPSDAPSGQ
jgi:hypothetical protein